VWFPAQPLRERTLWSWQQTSPTRVLRPPQSLAPQEPKAVQVRELPQLPALARAAMLVEEPRRLRAQEAQAVLVEEPRRSPAQEAQAAAPLQPGRSRPQAQPALVPQPGRWRLPALRAAALSASLTPAPAEHLPQLSARRKL